MTYEDIAQYISASHLYENVSDDELNAIAVTHYMTVVSGIRYVGTYDPVEALADRELIPTPQPAPVETQTDTGTESTATDAPEAPTA